MKRFTFVAWLTIVLALEASLPARAQAPLGPKDSASLSAADLTRLKVGDEAPDFTLEDQDARPVTLSGYRGKKSVVLVFYRGYW